MTQRGAGERRIAGLAARILLSRTLGPPGEEAGARSPGFVREILEEPGELVEVGSGLDEADDGDEGLRVDQGVERHVVEAELARARDHHAVQALLDQGAVGADAELAAEDDVERGGEGASGLVAELQPG